MIGMTEAELDRFELLWKRRTPVKRIAKELGYSVNSILSIASRNRDRFPYRHRPVDNKKMDVFVERIIDNRMTVDDAARLLNVNSATVAIRVNRRRKMYEQARVDEGAGEG